EQAVLFELRLDEAERERGAVDGHSELPQDVRQRPDMVLVAVAEDDRPHPSLALDEVGDVRNHQVDAKHFVVGEHDAAVEDEDFAVLLDGPEVLSDLTGPAERKERNG